MVSKEQNFKNEGPSKLNPEAAAGLIEGNGSQIEQFLSKSKGRMILPGDVDYDKARSLFYGGIDKKPAVILRPVDTEDVVAAVALARETGLELAVRSGGHSYAGHSATDGGILLDLREMRALSIDPVQKTAWAESGLTAGEYTTAAAAHGLATGFGDTGSVGIGGITLGGGVGYLVRKYGLTIDNLLAAEIVTADGQVLQVDAENYPDLFWAIRGGGGNFGVVTRFRYRLHEVDTIVGGILILPATADAMAGFMAAAEAAPEELSSILNVMPAPPMPFIQSEHYGKLVLMAIMAYAGDTEAGQRAIAPFRALAEPLADMIRPMRYPELFMPEEEGYHPTAVARTMFLEHIDHSTAETILQTLQNSDASFRVAQLRVLGGAAARVPADATAYAHRQAKIMANLAAFYNTPEERERLAGWVDNFAASIHQGNSSAYVNFLGDEGWAGVQAAYPSQTLERLAAVKARYDPNNLFRLNHNIPARQ